MNKLQDRIDNRNIIEYVRYVLDLDSRDNEDTTVKLLLTRQYGLITPNTVRDWIAKGYIQVINDKKAA